jgi:hypothetical protein
MDVPGGYADDSFYVRASSGEHVEISPSGQSGQGGGTFQFFIDARGASDPSAVEAAGYRGAQRALAAAGLRADRLQRMGTQ